MQSRSVCSQFPIPGSLAPPPPRPRTSLPPSVPEHVGGSRARRPPLHTPDPALAPRDPRPAPGQLTWLAGLLPARRPVSGPPGPRAPLREEAAAAGR